MYIRSFFTTEMPKLINKLDFRRALFLESVPVIDFDDRYTG